MNKGDGNSLENVHVGMLQVHEIHQCTQKLESYQTLPRIKISAALSLQ